MQGRARRSARRLLRERPLRLQQRPAAHAAPALRQPLAPREEGSRRRRCPSRSSRSSSGSTAPCRSSTAPSITAGVLEWNKAFEKIGFKDAIRVEVQPDDADFDTLDFGRASIRWMTNASPSLRRDRPEPRRSAQRRDPRRRHRHREPVVAQHPRRALADPLGERRRQPVPRRRCDAARAGAPHVGPGLHLRRDGGRADDLRHRRPRGARRSRARQPRGRGVRRGLPQGRDDARGRPHARPAPQLPRVARLHRSSSSPTRCSRAQQRHHRLGDGVRADQPEQRRRSRASATARRSTTPSARTTTGRSSTPTSRCRRACRPPKSAPRSRRSPAAAPSRCSPTAPTRTTSSASIPRRCSSTSAATSSPSPRSGSRSRRSCSSVRRRERCVPTRTTTSSSARSAMRCATSPAPPTCCRARSAASAPCATRRAPDATR